MATVKQKKALEKIVENGGNVSKAMREAGYSKETAHSPQKLTESKGFKELLEQYGLTEQLITEALVQDIKAKPGKRVKELALGADILKMKQSDTIVPTINLNFFNADQLRDIARAYQSGNPDEPAETSELPSSDQ